MRSKFFFTAVAALAVLSAASRSGADVVTYDFALAGQAGSFVSDATGAGPVTAGNIALASVSVASPPGPPVLLPGYTVSFETGLFKSEPTPGQRVYRPGGGFDVFDPAHNDVFHGVFVGDSYVTTLPNGVDRVQFGEVVGTTAAPIGPVPGSVVLDIGMTTVFASAPSGAGGFVSTTFGSGDMIATAAVPEPGSLALGSVVALAGAALAYRNRRKAA